jgi:hypothetical protein
MTSIPSNTRTARLARPAGRARAFSVPLLAVGVLLAAGCGTVHAPSSGGATASSGSSTAVASAIPSVSAAPAASATPVPTVTGGPVVAGEPACAGWPAYAPHGTLTALFDAVAVERCVTGYQTGPGRAEWQTATLEKATRNLTPLLDALLQPSAARQSQIICPELAMIPPQVLLISSTGRQLIPWIPLSACSTVQSRFLSALAALTWQPVSVRLVSKVLGSQPMPATPAARSSKAFTTLPANERKTAGPASLSWSHGG